MINIVKTVRTLKNAAIQRVNSGLRPAISQRQVVRIVSRTSPREQAVEVAKKISALLSDAKTVAEVENAFKTMEARAEDRQRKGKVN